MSQLTSQFSCASNRVSWSLIQFYVAESHLLSVGSGAFDDTQSNTARVVWTINPCRCKCYRTIVLALESSERDQIYLIRWNELSDDQCFVNSIALFIWLQERLLSFVRSSKTSIIHSDESCSSQSSSSWENRIDRIHCIQHTDHLHWHRWVSTPIRTTANPPWRWDAGLLMWHLSCCIVRFCSSFRPTVDDMTDSSHWSTCEIKFLFSKHEITENFASHIFRHRYCEE